MSILWLKRGCLKFLPDEKVRSLYEGRNFLPRLLSDQITILGWTGVDNLGFVFKAGVQLIYVVYRLKSSE